MGSTCDVSIDGLSFWGTKSYVDDEILSVFFEPDRREGSMRRPQYGGREEAEAIVYAASADAMRGRLDAMGFTLAHARADYRKGHADDCDLHHGAAFSDADRREVRDWTYDRWRQAVARLASKGFQTWNSKAFPDDPDAERLADGGQLGLGSCFSDVRFLLRGLLDALPEAAEVVLDVTNLVTAGYYGTDDAICSEARRGWAHQHSLYGSILLLTEGRSDARILRETFARMAPDLAGLYGFLDFDGLRIEGSADALPKTLRSLIGAGVAQRIVAIFDNDTAGLAAMTSLPPAILPDHIRVMALPENATARSFPTIGPQGDVVMDVNGLACGIEMYLGDGALRAPDGGSLRVRWTGFNQRMQRYQGVIEDKEGVSIRYLERLRGCATPAEARRAFPEMANVIDAIAAQFSSVEPAMPAAKENPMR